MPQRIPIFRHTGSFLSLMRDKLILSNGDLGTDEYHRRHRTKQRFYSPVHESKAKRATMWIQQQVGQAVPDAANQVRQRVCEESNKSFGRFI